MSQKEQRSNNFIVQGGILAVTGIISRIIGLAYRVPLQKTIGDAGMGYYSAAFQIYSIMLIISSYSLPVAVSKLVSARIARGQYRNARRIYHGAFLFACLTGGATCLITLFCADTLATSIMNMPKSAIALRMLGPTLLIVAIMGVMRGYFQGTGTMFPTAISQLVEQIVNAIISVVAAVYLIEYGSKVASILLDEEYKAAWGAAGGTLGTGAGALAGLIILIIMMITNSKRMGKSIRKDTNSKEESFGKIFGFLVITILPVILSTTIYNISDTIDQSLFNYIMDLKGRSSIKAEYWGIYSTKYRVLTNVPIALANALCSSMMPSLTSCIEKGERKLARHKVAIATRFCMIISIPCAVGLAVLGEPIIRMLFDGEYAMPAMLLRVGSISVVFYSLSTLSNGVLQGIDKMRIPVRNAAIALVIHLLILFLTINTFDWQLYGVVLSCIMFGFIMCVLNWMSIRKHLRYKQEIIRTFVIPTICSIIMGIVVWLSYFIMSKATGTVISVFFAIVIGCAVYFVTLLLFRGVKENEVRSFPGGHIIVKIAKIFHLL